jgi:hypothetical protein
MSCWNLADAAFQLAQGPLADRAAPAQCADKLIILIGPFKC